MFVLTEVIYEVSLISDFPKVPPSASIDLHLGSHFRYVLVESKANVFFRNTVLAKQKLQHSFT